MEIDFQQTTERVTLFISMPFVHYEGSARNRMPVSYEFMLANRLERKYDPLITELAGKFGEPYFYACSYSAAASLLHCAFYPLEIGVFELLDPDFSFIDYKDELWLPTQESFAPHLLVRELLKEPGIFEDPAVVTDRAKLRAFMTQPGDDTFRLAMVNEPFLSLGLRGFLNEHELGLKPGHGVLVQSAEGKILHAELVSLDRDNVREIRSAVAS